MKKHMNKTWMKTALAAAASLACFSAHGQGVQFPTDGTANSFNSKLAQTEKNTAQQTKNLAISYVTYLKETMKLTPTQAAGLVGNLMYASGGAEGLNSGWQQGRDSATIGPATMTGNVSNYSGSGIAQWQDSRKQGLINFARYGKLPCENSNEKPMLLPAEPNMPTSSQVANFGFLLHELTCSAVYKGVLPALKAETTLVGAVCTVEKLYEQPLQSASAQRLKFANVVAGWVDLPVAGGAEPSGDVCAKPGGSPPPGGGGLPPITPGSGGANGIFTNSVKSYGQLQKYEQFIIAASRATGVPVDLIAAVIWDESSGNANVGCTRQPGSTNLFNCGLMQIRCEPGSFVATDPATNIMQGAQWIARDYRTVTEKYGSPEQIMSKYKVSAWDLALRMYNSGWVDPNNLDNGYLATAEYVRNIHKFTHQLHNTGWLAW